MTSGRQEKPGMSAEEFQQALIKNQADNGQINELLSLFAKNISRETDADPDEAVTLAAVKGDIQRPLSQLEEFQKFYDDAFDYILSAIPEGENLDEDSNFLNNLKKFKKEHVIWAEAGHVNGDPEFLEKMRTMNVKLFLMIQESESTGKWIFNTEKDGRDGLELSSRNVSRFWAGLHLLGFLSEYFMHGKDVPKVASAESLVMRMIETRLRTHAVNSLSNGKYIDVIGNFLRKQNVSDINGLYRLMKKPETKNIRKMLDRTVAGSSPCVSTTERRMRDFFYVQSMCLYLLNLFEGPLHFDVKTVETFRNFMENGKMNY